MQQDLLMEFFKEDHLYDIELPDIIDPFQEAASILENEVPELINTPYLHEALVAIHEMQREISTMADLDEAIDEIVNKRDAYKRLPAIYRIICWIGGIIGAASYGAAWLSSSNRLANAGKMATDATNTISRITGGAPGWWDKVKTGLDGLKGKVADTGSWFDKVRMDPNTALPNITMGVGDSGAAGIAGSSLAAAEVISASAKSVELQMTIAQKALKALGIIGISAFLVYLGWRLVNYFASKSGEKVFYANMSTPEKKECLKKLLVETDKFMGKLKNDKDAIQHLKQTKDQLITLIRDLDFLES